MGDIGQPLNLRFHHGGVFVKGLTVRYKNEKLAILWISDRDKLHYLKIERYVRSLGYNHEPEIYWLKPGYSLDDGLVLMSDDKQVFEIFSYCGDTDSVDFYLGHAVDLAQEV